jgi:NTP pyrophosphatase (non-canonical NTP hydrolase)
MKNYIEQALTTEAPITPELANRLITDARAVHAIFGLATEIGELTDSFKRTIFYGKHADRTNIAEEIGDAFWYLAILCDHVGVSFEQCMVANINKLRARYPNKFTEHDAVNRDLGNERAVLERHVPDDLQATEPRASSVANGR